jgi:hypothetical protein
VLPRRWWVRSGDAVFAELVVGEWQINEAAAILPSAEN